MHCIKPSLFDFLLQGGVSFVIIANQVLPTGLYHIKFGNYGTNTVYGTGERCLYGSDNIPAGMFTAHTEW